MKKILVVFFVLFSVTVFAQNPVNFTTTKHSFGKITQHKPVTYFFVFKNTSDKPLVIENAEAECGCTKPEYPKEPVMKGKEAKIKVTYNAEALGSFSKKVTLKFVNYAEPVIITIEGEVIAAAK
jgi:hypothetical protein